VNAVQVQMWMGHHSPAFTQAVYVHLLSSDLPDGDVFDESFGPSGGNGEATRATETRREGSAVERSATPVVAGETLAQARLV
jgi:hypothetical protein